MSGKTIRNGKGGKASSRARKHGPEKPSLWVKRFLPGIGAGGSILDVACGSGRHMRLALKAGYAVTGIDRDLGQVEDLATRNDVGLIEADLESGRAFPLKDMRYDGVIVANYLWRPILDDIIGCVEQDGVFIYETFALGHERLGRPSNPEFLLKANELLDAVAPKLVVVAYEHGLRGNKVRNIVQRIAACGPEHPWARDKPVQL